MGFRSATIDVKKLAGAFGISESEARQKVAGCRVGGYAKLWSFEDKGKYGRGNISTSEKKQGDGTYETTFRDGMVSFFGPAYEKAKQMSIPEGGIPIVILSCDVKNRYDGEKKRLYTNYTVYDFEMSGGGQRSRTQEARPQPQPASNDIDEELPF